MSTMQLIFILFCAALICPPSTFAENGLTNDNDDERVFGRVKRSMEDPEDEDDILNRVQLKVSIGDGTDGDDLDDDGLRDNDSDGDDSDDDGDADNYDNDDDVYQAE
ncbi:hypothetical protein FGIG_03977 [Fasciola gigantica]|uniref:Uncharacterized protein n=1 Tax=Fasciola gigantica TaxID=46835 RepID=A0A504YNK9_FASGI|nr:hypothetical protein FGIG_03977 [Fasciola gigantica]